MNMSSEIDYVDGPTDYQYIGDFKGQETSDIPEGQGVVMTHLSGIGLELENNEDRLRDAEKELIAHDLVLSDLTGKYNKVIEELHRVKVLTTIGLCLIAGSMVATFLCILAAFGYL